MGNSEVGHLNLGAGAVVRQDLTRIDDAVADGSLAANEVLRDALAGAERVHLIGLVSDGGVHSGFEHLRGADRAGRGARRSRRRGPRLHRRPRHAADRGSRLSRDGRGLVCGGRQRARRQRGRALLRDGSRPPLGPHPARLRPARARPRRAQRRDGRGRREAYERGETDEFVTPTLVGDEAAIRPAARHASFAFNFRPDRMRQITRALAEPGFDEVDRGGAAPVERYATMTEYEEGWPYPVAFPPERPRTRSPACSPSTTCPSCTSPRPRSTRT